MIFLSLPAIEKWIRLTPVSPYFSMCYPLSRNQRISLGPKRKQPLCSIWAPISFMDDCWKIENIPNRTVNLN